MATVYRIEIPSNTKSGWRKLPDCQFTSRENAEAYKRKYWTRYGNENYARVVEIQTEEK